MSQVEFSVRCKAFRGEGVRENWVKVDTETGDVRVYDDVAKHYVISRVFSDATTRRIAAMAPDRLAKQRGAYRASQYDRRSYRSEVV